MNGKDLSMLVVDVEKLSADRLCTGVLLGLGVIGSPVVPPWP